jgi:hypothetical protein
MRIKIKTYILCLVFSTNIFAENNHSAMHHQQMMKATESNLTQAGNDIFATIQEVIIKLNNNPDTDWSKVDIEALRQHLLDMNDMAVNVEILNQKPLINGLRIALQGTTARAEKTLVRVFKAHPMHLKRETGWDMQVERYGKQFIVTTTTEKPGQTQKIIALSYIGLMAYGKHHQVHHWGMSTGQNPHAKQH